MTEDRWLKMAQKKKNYGLKSKRREGANLLISEGTEKKNDNGTAKH
jgi:hypothetical protein